ncbi:FtsW/RodA/SpoVE family cell cycle protein [Metabacillus arenae]|uniref:Probable peptidoglycan glycosyltransferase FtsW n=1 Tax=Metabacillus arenae TaxID=2771434 RepID=A0A926NNA1_9BACI|nr:FtsW/RodA/SpoVE family cell cycle protein [Metabacillus arenae]MBD1380946.1 FtsW/RodA/SpoVE family cell cycle protein [Metabacillus arenae]
MIKKILKSYDYSLILAIFLLCGFGLVMVYSSSSVTAVSRYGQDPSFFFQRQLQWFLIGSAAFLFVMVIPYRAYINNKFLKLAVLGSFCLLVSLFVFGHMAGGANSWLKLFGASMQPGEYVKLSVILYLAAVYEKKQSYINKLGVGLLPPLVFTFLICLLVAVQPDFGTAAIIGMISLAVAACSGMNGKSLMKLILLVIIGFVIISPLLFIFSDSIFSPYRMSRLTGFTDPFETEGSSGYQLVNSYYAIGSGGLTGVGLGESVQKAGYLPESHTDFIMAIISEELGIFGVVFTLSLLGFIIFKGFYISRKCEDVFGSLLAVGISSMIAIQAGINLGGLTGLIPITGVTLPFISYGGSSLSLLLISMGVLVNISMFVNYRETYNKEMNEEHIPVKAIKQKPVSY